MMSYIAPKVSTEIITEMANEGFVIATKPINMMVGKYCIVLILFKPIKYYFLIIRENN